MEEWLDHKTEGTEGNMEHAEVHAKGADHVHHDDASHHDVSEYFGWVELARQAVQRAEVSGCAAFMTIASRCWLSRAQFW